MRYLTALFVLASLLMVGCQPAAKAPPPASQLIGGPCQYDEMNTEAVVSDSDTAQVRFLINGQVIPYSRQDLPDQYAYASGDKFNVVEKRITEGTCTPYILEIVSATRSSMPPPPPAEQTTIWRYPDPSLK